MFQIGKTLVSEDLIEKDFVCNISACKGECCIDGDAGAPLDEDELQKMEEVYPVVKPYLSEESIKAIDKQGIYVKGEDGDWETPLLNGQACVYVIYDDNNTAKCAIEEAYNKGEVSWKKPVSCHLYPIRVKSFSKYSAVNYDKWDICSDACSLGKELQVPVFKFVKEALVRKFGQPWYDELELVAEEWKKRS
jgi:hypothetical protein